MSTNFTEVNALPALRFSGRLQSASGEELGPPSRPCEAPTELGEAGSP